VVISDSARRRRIEGRGILAFERRASIMTIVLKRAPGPSADGYEHFDATSTSRCGEGLLQRYQSPHRVLHRKSKDPLPGACIPVTRSLQKNIRSHSGRV
jgi:hypothetical protein